MMSLLLKGGWRILSSRLGVVAVACGLLWGWHVYDKRQAVEAALDGYVLESELSAAKAQLEATGGQYSHVELIEGSADFDTVQICLSSSGRDGGVREKRMKLDPAKWDLVEMKVDAEGPAAFIRDKIGRRYDYPALIFSQFFALGRHNPDRWFCSEIVAASLGLDQPHRLSPQMLFEVVTWELRRTAKGG